MINKRIHNDFNNTFFTYAINKKENMLYSLISSGNYIGYDNKNCCIKFVIFTEYSSSSESINNDEKIDKVFRTYFS